MTIRERASLTLVIVGLLLVAVAAWAYGGWRAVVAALGGMLVLLGVLFGLDSEPTPEPAAPPVPWADDDDMIDEDGVQRG